MNKNIKVIATATLATMLFTGCVNDMLDKLSGDDNGNADPGNGESRYEALMGDVPHQTEDPEVTNDDNNFVTVDPIESDGE